MADVRVEKLADVLVNYSVAVRPGDKVGIRVDDRVRVKDKVYRVS